jgi:hypothetical protein
MTSPTSPKDSKAELREKVAELVLKFRQNGYWDDALLELEPHNREFVDTSSWAGELHWEAMQKLYVDEIMAAIDTHVKESQTSMLKRIMDSRDVHAQVTNGHIHVKNVDYEYYKLTGERLL